MIKEEIGNDYGLFFEFLEMKLKPKMYVSKAIVSLRNLYLIVVRMAVLVF